MFNWFVLHKLCQFNHVVSIPVDVLDDLLDLSISFVNAKLGLLDVLQILEGHLSGFGFIVEIEHFGLHRRSSCLHVLLDGCNFLLLSIQVFVTSGTARLFISGWIGMESSRAIGHSTWWLWWMCPWNAC